MKSLLLTALMTIFLFGNDTDYDPKQDVLECNNNIVINYQLVLQEPKGQEIYYLVHDLDTNILYYEWDCIKVEVDNHE